MELNIICAALITITLLDVPSETIMLSDSLDDYDDNLYMLNDDTTIDKYDNISDDAVSLEGVLRKKFAYSLILQRIRNNTICSPLSALMSLGKLALGASNNTLQELLGSIGSKNLSEKTLSCCPVTYRKYMTLDIYDLGKIYAALHSTLCHSLQEPPKIRTKLHFKYMVNQLLRMANVTINMYSAIYVNDKYEIQNEFTKDSIEIFDASVESLNFSDPAEAAKTINTRVSKDTNVTVRKIIKESELTPDAEIVLVNAVYFSGQWRYSFEKTQKEVFYGQGGPHKVNMMLTVADFFYYESKFLKAQVIQLPYICHEGMTMIIFLPISKSSKALKVLLEVLNGEPTVLNSVLKSMKIHRVHVSLPRFKIYTNFDLGKQYEKVGLKSLFQEGLDKMVKDKDIFVSKAVQAAIIQVNENGTMAASAPPIVNMTSNDEDVPPVAKFIANHPFHFILLAKNEQLFSGVLNNVLNMNLRNLHAKSRSSRVYCERASTLSMLLCFVNLFRV